MWVVLIYFPSHCQCPEADLTSGPGTPRRNNHGSAPFDRTEHLYPTAQLTGVLDALNSTQLMATGEGKW